MDEAINSSEGYISARPTFSLKAANDGLSLSDERRNSRFTEEEYSCIQEAIYPLGGSLYISDIMLNNPPLPGQRADIHIPLAGSRQDSHMLSLYKVPPSEKGSPYSLIHIQANIVFESNEFKPTLQNIMTLLGKRKINEFSPPQNGYNG